tara:strand:- start:557 stop:1144 length:588 start_codon:yes stop_codon:yes gene_type:complete
MAYKLGSKAGTKYKFGEVAGLTGGDPEKEAAKAERKETRIAQRQKRQSKRRHGTEEDIQARTEAMHPEEAASYKEGVSKNLSEKKMVKEGLIPKPTEHHKYQYDISGRIARDEEGYYKEIPKTLSIAGRDEEPSPPSIGKPDKVKVKKQKSKIKRSRSKGRYNITKAHKRKGKRTKGYVATSGRRGKSVHRRGKS